MQYATRIFQRAPAEADAPEMKLRKMVADGERAQKEIREREVARLLKAPCNCDRYACQNCQRLQALDWRSTRAGKAHLAAGRQG